MELYYNQLQNAKYDTYKKHQFIPGKGNTYPKYSDDILTLDIEASSSWIDKKGKIISYKPGKSNEYWNSLTPISLCYIYQFSFNDKVYYGRELRDFEKILQDLNPNINYVIWVHNLSYEFHFLTDFLEWKEVFARSPHKPMKAIPLKYPNVEFRCSYMLTRLSLRTWGKDMGIYKDDPIDYEKLRTPITKLTDTELHYAEQDCIVTYNGIKQYLKRYKHIHNIPLTQTGTVRREVKNLLMSDNKYAKFIKGLIPYNADEYQMLMNLFSGGYTHASRAYSGKVIKGHIEHYDFASSYPTVMVAEKYPMSLWVNISYDPFPKVSSFNKYAYIFKLKFYKLKCDTYNTYIQDSKAEGERIVKDNGRIILADTLITTMTEQDYLIIKETYTWSKMEVLEMYKSKKDYLPKAFVNYVLDLYKNKTELKGVKGKEEIYTQSKQYINSLFGMCVTAIVQSDIKFNGKDWIVENLTRETVEEKLKELKTKYRKDKRYFLSYSWGIWITAYARRNLWKCIEKYDTKILYCDTDSIFMKGRGHFAWYNKEITDKLRKACKSQGINFNKTRPKTTKGKAKPLGIFEKEEDCIEFITLGAKRYVERREGDKQLHLTVSGINKEAVKLLNNKIENFKNNFNFDKDHPSVHKQLSIYNNNMPEVTYPDGYHSTYKCGINMRRTGYLLTIGADYQQLLDLFNTTLEDLHDSTYTKLRKIFI